VEPGEGALDDPADAAKPGAVLGLAACDDRSDASLADEAAVLVVVVAAVGDELVGTKAGPADNTAHGRDPLDQGDELGDVVAVAAGHCPGKRDPGRVYEKVMLGAVSGSINRARARRGAPFFACT
jgi:hypothetical protein